MLLRRASAAKEGSGLGVVFAALCSLANDHGAVEWTLLRELPPLVALLEVCLRVASVQSAIGGGGWRYNRLTMAVNVLLKAYRLASNFYYLCKTNYKL